MCACICVCVCVHACVCMCVSVFVVDGLDGHAFDLWLSNCPQRLRGKDLLRPLDENSGARRPLVAWKDQCLVQVAASHAGRQG